ncbi:MAG: riboflavin synthase [Nitrospiraceae bacterium]|nr:MAG: riboflavin synthase [Nitrospiraceae bacterium]
MFTGLVETKGIVASVENAGNGIRLSVKPLADFEVNIGDSVCVNGVCLTVTKQQPPYNKLSFDVSPETMRSTNLGALKVSDNVNLERALRLSDRLGGHLVTGHVDGVGSIRDKRQAGEYTFYTFEAPAQVLRYIVKKGSVTVDGISLTVVDIDKGAFSVAIIPHTLTATIIGEKRAGDRVNLEADIIGKYVEKFLGMNDKDKNLMALLKQEGFAD